MSRQTLDVVILAAGQGKRMYSHLPKVLHPIAGKPMLQHVVDTAHLLEPDHVCIVYGHGGAQVRDAIHQPGLKWVLQAGQLGTGHAVQHALPELHPDGQTLVLYGDVPLIASDTLQRLVEVANGDVALLTVHLHHPHGYGRIIRDAHGKVQAIVEEKDASREQKLITEVNTGIMVLPNRCLAGWLAALKNHNAQGEFYLTDLVEMAVREGVSIQTVEPVQLWEVAGVNNKIQLAELERAWQQHLAKQLLARGVTLADPQRIDIRGTLECAQDVSIDVNCLFEGEVTLEEGVHIGANCILKNVQIGAGTMIYPFSHIEGSEIGEHCQIGPFARLRPGSLLEREVKVGNFVEIKKTHLSFESKVNHLSYVGDAEIGAHVNIGAGTITCNYDGAHKFKTTIGDRAFIGSGTMLVAPVTLGDDVTIGAGSTITKNVETGALSLTRPQQKTILEWKRPLKKSKERS